MDALGNILNLVGVLAFFVGVVIIVRPIQSLGFSRRFEGGLVILASFAVVALAQQVSPELKQQAAARTAAAALKQAATADRPVSKSEALQKLRIGGFRWEKDGFGTIMKATFVIYNDNKFPVKDATISCTHAANSGSKIDSNIRTVYERIDARGYHSVVEMSMGFIHSAVSSTNCQVIDFSQV